MVSLDEIARINPAIVLDGVVGGSFRQPPTATSVPSGSCRATSMPRCAPAHGCSTTPGRSSLELTGDRIAAVTTRRGRIAADHVVNATGAWAADLARLAGVDLPVTPVRRQVALTAPTNALPPSTPMTIFAEDGFHFRVRDGRVLLLWPVDTTGCRSIRHHASMPAGWRASSLAHTGTRARAPLRGDGSCRQLVRSLRDVARPPRHSWRGTRARSTSGSSTDHQVTASCTRPPWASCSPR